MQTSTEVLRYLEFVPRLKRLKTHAEELGKDAALELLKKQTIEQHLKTVPALFDFVCQQIDLQGLDPFRTAVLSADTTQGASEVLPASLDCFVALPRINRHRRLNSHFLEVYEKLAAGGRLLGWGSTIGTENTPLNGREQTLLDELRYLVTFVNGRFLPKLPGVRQIYSSMLHGRQRILSKAEILGRLYYSGFDVTATKQVGHDFFFIAEKNGRPCNPSHSSEAFLIKLKRLGLHGKPIYINKLRTMYPYSEYAQQYVFRENKLHPNGKFNRDFRITGWGRILRRFWIDELPQLINLVKGDVRVVGVRALSEHYFSLYPKDLQKLRCRFRPGLVPPYYADLPNSFDEIIASERRYLQKKQAHPIKTDIEYFCKAMVNIIFRKARSN